MMDSAVIALVTSVLTALVGSGLLYLGSRATAKTEATKSPYGEMRLWVQDLEAQVRALRSESDAMRVELRQLKSDSDADRTLIRQLFNYLEEQLPGKTLPFTRPSWLKTRSTTNP